MSSYVISDIHGCYNAGKDCVFMILTVAVRFGAESRVQGLPVFGWKMKKILYMKM